MYKHIYCLKKYAEVCFGKRLNFGFTQLQVCWCSCTHTSFVWENYTIFFFQRWYNTMFVKWIKEKWEEIYDGISEIICKIEGLHVHKVKAS